MLIPIEIIDLVVNALGATPEAHLDRCSMMLVCRAWHQAVRCNLTHRAWTLAVLARDSTHLEAARRQLGLTPEECAECEKTGRVGAAKARLHEMLPERGRCWGRDASIKIMAERMVTKTDRVVEGIVAMAKKTKVTKMYSVPGYHVAKRVSRALAGLDIASEIVTSGEKTRNQLTGIEPGYDSGCCRECDGPTRFYSSKVPVVYVRVPKGLDF